MTLQPGDRFTSSYSVDRMLVEGFIGLFGDRNILHTNADYARRCGFREQVVHGNILGGFVSHWVGESLPLKNVMIQQQQLKFARPVYAGDVLELQGVVRDFHESVQVAEIQLSFTNQDGQVVARGMLQLGVLPS